MRKRILLVLALVAGVACAAEQYPYRWFRLQCDFRKEADVVFAEGIARRAAATGVYNGVLLDTAPDAAISTCASWDGETVARFGRFRGTCARGGIEIIPTIWSVGYGAPLSVEPDLAEGLPVRGVAFERRGAKGRFVRDEAAVADFARLKGPYAFDAKDAKNGLNRGFHPFRAAPFKTYRCRYRAKAEDLNPEQRFQILFYSGEANDYAEPLRGVYPVRKPTTDWFDAQFDFYSGEREEHRLGIGVWSFTQGRAEVASITIEEVAPTAFLRREGTPISIRDAVTGAAYEEGRDVVLSPARNPWTKEGRRPVEVSFPAGSRVPEGGRILIDGYAPAVIGWDQYPACMCAPGLSRHFERSADDIARLFGGFPKRVMLSNDETRAGGTCEACRQSGLDLPHIYARMVEAEMKAVRRVSPDTEMLIWTDMMDPLHNANRRGRYFLCTGDYFGTRDLIPRDLVAACWYRPNPEASVKGFADAGFATCAATYYDSGSLDSSRRWLKAGNATKGFKGLIYASWGSGGKQDFRFLEDFAEMLRTESAPLSDTSPRELGEERLRIGLLSDIHVTVEEHRAYFEKALRAFDAWKCDGVLVCGDLADYGLEQQLKYVADTWWKVFPDGKGSDGRPVANLLHYGDHDSTTNYSRRVEYPKVLGDADESASLLFNGENHRKFWEKYFHEPFSYLQVKDVKGYTFVLNHFRRGVPDNPYGNQAPGVAGLLAKLKLDPARPFFYSQHRPPRGTHYAPDSWGQDAGETTRIFARYPNAVVLTGHIHHNAADERSVWQGAFNSVQVPSLGYNTTRPGRENSYSLTDNPLRPPFPTLPIIKSHGGSNRQGLFMTVYDRAIVFRRWNFANDTCLGPDWTLPLDSFVLPADEKPFAPSVRARTCPVPAFAADAKVSVRFTEGKDRGGVAHRFFQVEFLPAEKTDRTPRADEYSVVLEIRRGDLVRTFLEKRVFFPDCLTGQESRDRPVVCPFTEAEVPDSWATRFVVRPHNAFGVAGEPIATPWEGRQ